jgi:hypothetical protein
MYLMGINMCALFMNHILLTVCGQFKYVNVFINIFLNECISSMTVWSSPRWETTVSHSLR